MQKKSNKRGQRLLLRSKPCTCILQRMVPLQVTDSLKPDSHMMVKTDDRIELFSPRGSGIIPPTSVAKQRLASYHKFPHAGIHDEQFAGLPLGIENCESGALTVFSSGAPKAAGVASLACCWLSDVSKHAHNLGSAVVFCVGSLNVTDIVMAQSQVLLYCC